MRCASALHAAFMRSRYGAVRAGSCAMQLLRGLATPSDCSCGLPGGSPGVMVALDGVTAAPVIDLVYELLDAHDDTARLAAGLRSDPEWREHLDYLRDLQRVGREALAHAPVGVIA